MDIQDIVKTVDLTEWERLIIERFIRARKAVAKMTRDPNAQLYMQLANKLKLPEQVNG